MYSEMQQVYPSSQSSTCPSRPTTSERRPDPRAALWEAVQVAKPRLRLTARTPTRKLRRKSFVSINKRWRT